MMDPCASIPNEELYERCWAGDDLAWAHVYRYVLRICTYPQWRLGHQAEDVAQGIIGFLLEKGMEKVAQPQYFRTFLKTVTVNKIKDSYKRKESRYEVCVEDEILEVRQRENSGTPANPGPECAVMQKELIAVINQELLHLPDFCQKVMPEYFRYKTGILDSYQELAHILGLPAGTISSYVYRCLKILQQSKALRAFL